MKPPPTRRVSPVAAAFGGFLDVAHGFALPGEQERQLRFQILFSDSVVAPDSFFHCYGPIFNRAKSFVARGLTAAHEEVENDLVMASLRSGAILPVMRTNESTLEENFLSDRVTPRGQYLIPGEREAVPVLRFLDKLLGGRRATSLWSREHSRRSYHALHRRFVVPGDRECRSRIAKAAGLPVKRDRSWNPLLEEFIESVEAQAESPFFQRGPLERTFAKALHVKDSHVYATLASLRGRRLNAMQRLARHLYREMLFYYQVGQGTAFADLASVTTALQGHLPDLKALREAVGFEAPGSGTQFAAYREQVDLRFLDRLKVKDLIALRDGPLRDFRERVMRLHATASTEDFHARLVEESAEYRRTIASRLQSPIIEHTRRLLPYAAEIGAMATNLPRVPGIALWVGLAAADYAAPKAQKLHERELTSKLGHAFNNFLSSTHVL